MTKAVPTAIAGTVTLAAGVALTVWWPGLLPDTARGLLCGLGVGLLLAAALASRLPRLEDMSTAEMRRRYRRSIVPAAIAYALSLLLSTWLLTEVDVLALRVLVALLPLPAIVMALRAVMRHVRDADEMQQRIELEAVSLATAGVSLVFLAGSFLQAAHLIDVPSGPAMGMVLPAVCFAYGLAKVAVVRRYV